MCDIYVDYCKFCGSPIPMHLGDFETDKFEIAVICPICIKNIKYEPAFVSNLPHKHWKAKEDEYIVVALTINAQSNSEMNHPNLVELERPIKCRCKARAKKISEQIALRLKKFKAESQ